MKRKEREYGPSERRLPEYLQPKRRKTFAQPTQNNTRRKFLAPYSVRIEKFPRSEECKSIIEKLENEGVLKANFDEIGYLCNNLKKVKKSNNDEEDYKKIMARIAAILFYRLNLFNPN